MQSHTQYTFEFESLICHPYFSSEEVRYRELCNITQTLSDEACICKVSSLTLKSTFLTNMLYNFAQILY